MHVFLQRAFAVAPVAAGVMLAVPLPAHAQTGGTRAALEEVIVTARRREENVQNTPLSISAITPEQLTEAGIKEIRDLTAAVPGVNMTASGGSNNTVFNMRGRSRGAVGNAQPSVATYVNEVPLSTWGASVPTYDLASVQVLKGPQGTLFGRNSTTGAVLINTAEPEYTLGGYISATFGDYSWQQYEGAINLPIIEDRVALRIAAQTARRDGTTDNMSFPGRDLDDIHRDNYRVSLLVSPIENLSNVLVWEQNKSDELPGGVFYSYNPSPTQQINLPQLVALTGGRVPGIAARQKAAGPRKAWQDVPAYSKGDLQSVSNTTTYEFGSATLKNIIGYRNVAFHNLSDIDSTELPLINADSETHIKQWTEELQLAGSALDERLDYVVGLFYLNAKPDGLNRVAIQTFAFAGTPMTSPGAAPFNGAYGNGDFYEDTSKAVYGQATYQLSALTSALDGVSVDLGLRYTKDEQKVCDAPYQLLGYVSVTESQCNSGSYAGWSNLLPAPVGAGPITLGTSKQSTTSNKVTYNIGLNYAATEDMLLYVVTRQGYRAGGLNTPIFSAGSALASSQQFDPETVQDVELGMKLNFSAGDVLGRFNVALFESRFKDLQVGISPGPNPDRDNNPFNDPSNQTFYSNVGEAKVKGVETEITVSPLNNLEVYFAGAYLDKEITSFDPPAGLGAILSEAAATEFAFFASPRYSYNAGLTYTWPMAGLGDLVFQYKYFKISDVHYGSVDAPAYERSDFRLAWNDIAESGVDVAAFVTNAFDADGIAGPALSSSGLGINSALYIEPRIWGAQVQYKFK